ncbi:MAG: hypothetical protein KF687_00670 [Cyclobacteriaceae bacterium]|nr:hypothetical protein [Cyclobacteriaceae bacterium]
MLRKDWKYILYLSVALVIYLALKMLSPRNIDWTITYHRKDKNPYGTYALDQLIESVFSKGSLFQSNYTLYELYDTLQKPANFLSLSTTFAPGNEDTKALLKNIEKGGTAFIAAQYFWGDFADTLSVATSDYFFDSSFSELFNRNDSTTMYYVNPLINHNTKYFFPRKNIHNYFNNVDSARTTIVAVNDLNLPVIVKITWGKGFLYLSSAPLTLTNVYLLHQQNAGFVSTALSHLPDRTTYWIEFYHLGRLEARTPLRFILSNEPLRWAYFISLFSILVFMIFESRRRQRIIPILKPLTNSSLEFIRTIGNLYFQSSDHKNIAEKRIAFFQEQLRTKYGIQLHGLNDAGIKVLSNKTGNSEIEVKKLLELMNRIHEKKQITENELKLFNDTLDRFKY